MQLDIGAHDFEKGVKQPIRFDIEVMLEGAESPTRDEIDEVLDYEYLHSSIESAISKRHSLLETLAASILEEILLPEYGLVGSEMCIRDRCRGWDLNPRSSTHRSLSPAPLTNSGTPAVQRAPTLNFNRADDYRPITDASSTPISRTL